MTRTRLIRRTRFLALFTAALAMVATGCASNGSTDADAAAPSGATTAAASSAAPAPGSMKLNVGQISNSVAFFPLFVAEDQGYFTDEGLTLGDRPRLGTGAKLAAALQSGGIDVAAGVVTDALNLAKNNDGTRIIGSLVNSYYVDIIVSKDGSWPAADAPIDTRIKALKGKKIGITGPGSGTEALVNYLANQVNLDPKQDLTLVNLGSNASAAVGALKAHRVDALSFFQPIGQQAEATGVGTILISPARGDVPSLEGVTHGIVFTTQSVLDDKGAAVAAFERAIARAEQTIHGDPALVAKLLAKYAPKMNADTVKALVPVLQREIPDNPGLTQQGYDLSVTFHDQTGLIKNAPAFDAIVPTAWIDSALKK
jgi:NitT/TauT family transport system substrate-binding protein